MLLFLLYLFLFQSNCYICAKPSFTKCNSNCSIVQICASRVLTCTKGPIDFPIIEKINCFIINNHFVLIDSEQPSIIDYIDPKTFTILFQNGMKSLLVGFGLRNVTRFMLSEVSENSTLSIFLNGYYIEHIENFSFEEKKMYINFISNPKLEKLSFTKYTKSEVKKETYCDSSSAPCLCKNNLYLNGKSIQNVTFYYNETVPHVCKSYRNNKCNTPICKLPPRTEFFEHLRTSFKKRIISDDYCLIRNQCLRVQTSYILYISILMLQIGILRWY